MLWWPAAPSRERAPDGAAFVGGDLHSLVADPTRPDTIYVGGHSAVSRSTDGGTTWERVESLNGADAMGWAFADGAIYVSGHPGLSVAQPRPGAFSRRNDGLPDTDLHAFGAGDATLYGAGPGAGVIASTDGGTTWETRTRDAGQAFFGRILVEDDGSSLLAADAQQGPVRSGDGGRTWTSLDGPPAVWLTRAGDAVIASGSQGAYLQRARSAPWGPLSLPDGAILVEADPHTPARLFAAGHSGSTAQLWISTDDGQTWDRT